MTAFFAPVGDLRNVHTVYQPKAKPAMQELVLSSVLQIAIGVAMITIQWGFLS
jgi:hypothetical protein